MAPTRPIAMTTRYRCLRCGRFGALDTPCLCQYGPPVVSALTALVLQVGSLGLLAGLGFLAGLLWGGHGR